MSIEPPMEPPDEEEYTGDGPYDDEEWLEQQRKDSEDYVVTCKDDRSLCDFVVYRMTDYGSQGTNIPYIAVELYCEGCESTAHSSCSWSVDPEDLEVYE